VKTSDTGTDQCIINYLVNLHFRFPRYTYFPEAVSNKYKWTAGPFHPDSHQNYDLRLLKKKTILTLYLILL
jgi:hypothetical protein